MTRYGFLLLLSLCTSCNSAYHGDRLDLSKVAVPDTVIAAQKATVPVPPPPPPAPPSVTPPTPWRAYIAPKVSPNGDVIEGHYLEISPVAPPAEAMGPARVLPRMPLVQYQAPPSATPQAPGGPPAAAHQPFKAPFQPHGQMPYGPPSAGPWQGASPRSGWPGPLMTPPGPFLPSPTPNVPTLPYPGGP